MIFCSIFVVVFFLIKKAPLIIKEAWSSNQEFLDSFKGNFLRILMNILIVFTSIIKVLLNPEIIYYLSYGVFAILATFLHPFFFAFHLTEFLMRYPTLRGILRSIYGPRKILFMVFVLIALFIYVFTVIGYMALQGDYNGRCTNLFLCFFDSFDKNFKYHGGIGGWL